MKALVLLSPWGEGGEGREREGGSEWASENEDLPSVFLTRAPGTYCVIGSTGQSDAPECPLHHKLKVFGFTGMKDKRIPFTLTFSPPLPSFFPSPSSHRKYYSSVGWGTLTPVMRERGFNERSEITLQPERFAFQSTLLHFFFSNLLTRPSVERERAGGECEVNSDSYPWASWSVFACCLSFNPQNPLWTHSCNRGWQEE